MMALSRVCTADSESTHAAVRETAIRSLLSKRLAQRTAGAVAGLVARRGGSGLDVLLHEDQGGVGDFTPAVVDGQGVPAAGDLDDLGAAWVALLPLVGGVGDGPRDGIVHLAVGDQQRPAVGVLGVHFRLGPRVEVGVGRLEQRDTRTRYREG